MATITKPAETSQRKYGPIWSKIKSEGKCIISCPRNDTLAIVAGVKKEKYKDKKKEKGKKLDIEVTDTGVIFRLVEDVSINNL